MEVEIFIDYKFIFKKIYLFCVICLFDDLNIVLLRINCNRVKYIKLNEFFN